MDYDGKNRCFNCGHEVGWDSSEMVCDVAGTSEDDTVLDNCMGSGTTAIACIKEKRHFVGFELNKEYFDKACKRIKAEQAQLTLW